MGKPDMFTMNAGQHRQVSPVTSHRGDTNTPHASPASDSASASTAPSAVPAAAPATATPAATASVLHASSSARGGRSITR
eukprot:scaffold30495_cov71-Phaeocystis_antarctica.AAC.8